MTITAIERRAWPRLQLELRVEFSSPGQATGISGTGSTANVSAAGMYFITPDWDRLKGGQSLAVRLWGLSGSEGGPTFTALAGKATVLRVDPPGAKAAAHVRAGVAVRFDERLRTDIYRCLP